MPLAIDLLHPSPERQRRSHKLKRLVQHPNSYFMDVKCPGCYAISTIFSHAQSAVPCRGCSTILCTSTGGKARLTEGCSFRRKQHLMADVLEINDAVDFDVEDEGDQSVMRLKDKVTKRKGRGFGAGATKTSEKNDTFESIDGGGDSGDAPGPQKSVEGWILFVTSVHEEASEEDLTEKFSEFGTIKNVNLNLDRRTGFLKGYALVEYETYEEADAARQALDGADVLGQTIAVDWCFVKGPKKGRKRTRRHYN